MLKNVKVEKKTIWKTLYRLFLVIIGTIVLGFGSGVFLVPFEIVSGGVTGIGILLADFLPVDVTAYIFSWSLFFLGLIFLGRRFSLTTLISTIIYPVMLSILLRSGFAEYIVNLMVQSSTNITLVDGVISDMSILTGREGLLLISGIIGGACVGIGCSLTFLGGGSTGGVDILSFLVNKFTGIKQSVLFFLTDGTIVTIGLIVHLVSQEGTKFVAGLIGIISAFICSLFVEIVYVSKEGAYMVDIVSDKYNEFVEFSSKVLDRSSTVYDVVGGYSQENKKVVRIVFNRREYIKMKDAIAKIDPDAFVTFTQTMLVGGEGFSKLRESKSNLIETMQKSVKNKKKDEQDI